MPAPAGLLDARPAANKRRFPGVEIRRADAAFSLESCALRRGGSRRQIFFFFFFPPRHFPPPTCFFRGAGKILPAGEGDNLTPPSGFARRVSSASLTRGFLNTTTPATSARGVLAWEADSEGDGECEPFPQAMRPPQPATGPLRCSPPPPAGPRIGDISRPGRSGRALSPAAVPLAQVIRRRMKPGGWPVLRSGLARKIAPCRHGRRPIARPPPTGRHRWL